MDADTSVDVLGSLCISMLSESLKLYLNTWDKIIGTRCGAQLSAEFRNQGFIAGFKTCFGHYLRLDWDECPSDFAILEQIVLARNDAQHASRIDEMRPTLSDKWKQKHPRPIFISDYERDIFSENDSEVTWNDPCLIVSRENLETAIGQVNLLAEWLEPKLHDFKHRPR
ncbi:hypothetical protein [Rhizobium wuzhouense]|uniref:Uncharacterized protein n=1 Tax=Rhizobium wuzhouense TaxID=1986026 RepID=A0ABX5NUM2_9HYPH|nr:hypothetical protein [Rhizobium wuzhouense]PYB75155.1 hypothetical protein DMY87_06745 [Rhizobium wuzhouense]